MLDCPDLSVPVEIMQHVIKVESAHNPYAIGVVGGRLARQPINQAEAIATAKMLEEKGYNFSLGIAQVNRYNLAKYGLPSYESAFNICPNLQAGSQILRECYDRSQDWGKAFSCYYSGNFVTGYKHGYVQKIFASIQASANTNVTAQDKGIQVYSNPGRRPVLIMRYAAYNNQPDVLPKEKSSTQVSNQISRRISSVTTRRDVDTPPALAESQRRPPEAPPVMAVLAGSKEDKRYPANEGKPSNTAERNIITANENRTLNRAIPGASSHESQNQAPAVAVLAGTENDIVRPVQAQTTNDPKMQDPAFVY